MTYDKIHDFTDQYEYTIEGPNPNERIYTVQEVRALCSEVWEFARRYEVSVNPFL